LEKIAQSLAEQAPPPLHEVLQERKRTVERWLLIAFAFGFTPLVLILVWKIVQNVIILEGAFLRGLLFLAILLGPAIALLLLLYREILRKALAKSQMSQLALSQTAPAKNLLVDSRFEALPSIAEHTTELLLEEERKRLNSSTLR